MGSAAGANCYRGQNTLFVWLSAFHREFDAIRVRWRERGGPGQRAWPHALRAAALSIFIFASPLRDHEGDWNRLAPEENCMHAYRMHLGTVHTDVRANHRTRTWSGARESRANHRMRTASNCHPMSAYRRCCCFVHVAAD
jgi:hypothetical protein